MNVQRWSQLAFTKAMDQNDYGSWAKYDECQAEWQSMLDAKDEAQQQLANANARIAALSTVQAKVVSFDADVDAELDRLRAESWKRNETAGDVIDEYKALKKQHHDTLKARSDDAVRHANARKDDIADLELVRSQNRDLHAKVADLEMWKLRAQERATTETERRRYIEDRFNALRPTRLTQQQFEAAADVLKSAYSGLEKQMVRKSKYDRVVRERDEAREKAAKLGMDLVGERAKVLASVGPTCEVATTAAMLKRAQGAEAEIAKLRPMLKSALDEAAWYARTVEAYHGHDGDQAAWALLAMGTLKDGYKGGA